MRLMMLVLLVSACGTPETMGDLCTEGAFYFCKRKLDTCPGSEPEPTHLECEADFVERCCADDARCDEEVAPGSSDECSADIRFHPCEEIAAGNPPISCIAP